jgi:hypothetical protein
MKKIGLLSLLICLGMAAFAAFPVDTQNLLIKADPEKFKLDTLGFILGILTIWMMPYSLALLFIKKKNFRGSLAWGWLAGLVLALLLVVLFVFLISGGSSSILLY